MDRYAIMQVEVEKVTTFDQPATRETAINFFTLGRHRHLLRVDKTCIRKTSTQCIAE